VSETHEQNRARRFAAAVRELNRHPRLVGAARATRHWALGEEEIDDRLSSTRGRPTDVAMRRLAALRTEEPGLLGELGHAVLQGWQTISESQGRGRGEVDVAVLFTDLAGFSSWALEAGDELTITLLREVSEAIEPPMLQRGEVVKRLGDGLMGAFRDAPRAVEAAFDACERLASVDVGGYRPRLRTGIHLGRPRKIGGDYFGVDVNIAARLAEAADPGDVMVSDRTLRALGPLAVTATRRPFSATGAPSELVAYAVDSLE
jgi:adenylate cyclase